MKQIELTKEHKSKLLEMCNTLFPDYSLIVLTNNKTIRFNYKKHPAYETWSKGTIHWFEFCWLLLNKILESNSSPVQISKTIHDFGLICFNQFKWLHPIDYLYEEFKKLKK